MKPGVPGMPGCGGSKGQVMCGLSVVVVSPSAADDATRHMTIAAKLNQGGATNYILHFNHGVFSVNHCIFYLEQ